MRSHFVARLSATGFAAAFSLGLAMIPANAADDPKVTAEIMAIVQAQWAAEMTNKPVAEQMKAIADDYTEFNPAYPVRIDGKAAAMRLTAASIGDVVSVAGEMLNPKVQTYGDTAILTYGYAGVLKDKQGKLVPDSAKSTRVYTKQGGKWMLVHANFAPVVMP